MRNLKSLPVDTIELFQSGNELGFDHYFNCWYKQFCFFALKFTKDLPAAEDIVSDCFIRVWGKREQFTKEAMLKSYFYISISNACKRWLDSQERKQRHLLSFKNQSELSLQPHIHNIICAETIHLIQQAIDCLPKRCSQVFFKMYVEEKSTSEIANEMNTTISTVKNQHARGLKLLRVKVSKQ